MTQPPVVGFGPSETGTVDARLLTGTKTDNGPVIGVSDGVGLRVLECKCSNNHVSNGAFGQLGVDETNSTDPKVAPTYFFLFGYDVCE